jgi:N-acetylmuramoyl-L-alanine amidase
MFSRRLLLGQGAVASFLSPAVALAERLVNPSRDDRVARTNASAPLVVLDPGHGGKDPGAIGVSGTYEKHVALAAAQQLRQLLGAEGRYRVELTRTRDVFIPLEDRVALAQQKGAALFVSMHADALADHSVRGASVYTLAEHASDAQTAALANRENASDRFAGPEFKGTSPDVARILASLVRQETRIGSARMSHGLVGALGQDVTLLQNPARHAGFVVLKAADIPSVLVEMGFMSNPEDEAALRQPQHRALVVAAMQRAIDAWFAQAGAPRPDGMRTAG